MNKLTALKAKITKLATTGMAGALLTCSAGQMITTEKVVTISMAVVGAVAVNEVVQHTTKEGTKTTAGQFQAGIGGR